MAPRGATSVVEMMKMMVDRQVEALVEMSIL
jgi:hypothetical protein